MHLKCDIELQLNTTVRRELLEKSWESRNGPQRHSVVRHCALMSDAMPRRNRCITCLCVLLVWLHERCKARIWPREGDLAPQTRKLGQSGVSKGGNLSLGFLLLLLFFLLCVFQRFYFIIHLFIFNSCFFLHSGLQTLVLFIFFFLLIVVVLK